MLRPKSGAADFQYYARSDVVAKFGPIRARLAERPDLARDPDLTNAGLARLAAELQHFMEMALGANARPPRRPVRLPAKLFRDFNPRGPLWAMLQVALQFKVRVALPGAAAVSHHAPYVSNTAHEEAAGASIA